MSIQQFLDKYNSKFIDFDGYYGAQCVDLIQQYNKEVFGGPFITGQGASDIWETYPVDYYTRILNTIDAIPKEGDIAIWKKTTSLPYGHIAIVKSAGQLNFTSLDQNWPTGSNCHYVEHNYESPLVLGFLRPIKKPLSEEQYYLGIDLTNIESVKVCIEMWKKVVDGLYVKKEELTSLNQNLEDKEETITNLNTQIMALEKEKNILADELKICQKEGQLNLELNKKLLQATQELNQLKLDYENERTNWKISEVAYNKQLSLITTKYNATKSSIKKLLIDYIFGKTA